MLGNKLKPSNIAKTISFAASRARHKDEYSFVPIFNWLNGIIASYPRSGNTYVRMLLAAYAMGKYATEGNIDNYVVDPYFSSVRTIISLKQKDALFLKWHALPVNSGVRTVYIRRSPVKVFYSLYSYLKYRHKIIECSAEEYARLFMTTGFGTFGNIKTHHRLWEVVSLESATHKVFDFEQILVDDAAAKELLEFLLQKPIDTGRLNEVRKNIDSQFQKRSIKGLTNRRSQFFGSKTGHDELVNFEPALHDWLQTNE